VTPRTWWCVRAWLVHPSPERSWLFRATWLFWCTIGPRINH